MFTAHEYELLDFGHGRKLERFGTVVLDRPCPVADGVKFARPELWNEAGARFEISCGKSSRAERFKSERGRWIISSEMAATWMIRHHKIRLELKLTPFGHVGVFPEQAENWDWIGAQTSGMRLRVLNLFAYTGGSTLSAAAQGAEVTHVDAARNVVTWARRNATLSGLSPAPIRWIADDAFKFARRELKRGQQYDAVILDPPSYGHGSRGEPWKLDNHLPEILSMCRELTGSQPRFLLLTCHAPSYHSRRLAECLITAGFAQRVGQVEMGKLSLCAVGGRRLNAGVFARMSVN
ncbi:MAG TPA: class I SAM-dependent methyltransferase [Pirellulales bacterium]|jgi:23S rRNA (cytosine1962-C5)-methyltransferase|nr:class I SAM-dependent methyltransferase [Pirellulales bacterium]